MKKGKYILMITLLWLAGVIASYNGHGESTYKNTCTEKQVMPAAEDDFYNGKIQSIILINNLK